MRNKRDPYFLEPENHRSVIAHPLLVIAGFVGGVATTLIALAVLALLDS